MKENNLNYESPTVELMEIAVEQGFAVSDTKVTTTPWGEKSGKW